MKRKCTHNLRVVQNALLRRVDANEKHRVVFFDRGDRLLTANGPAQTDELGFVLPHKLADCVVRRPRFDECLLRLYVERRTMRVLVRKLPAFDGELQMGPPWSFVNCSDFSSDEKQSTCQNG